MKNKLTFYKSFSLLKSPKVNFIQSVQVEDTSTIKEKFRRIYNFRHSKDRTLLAGQENNDK